MNFIQVVIGPCLPAGRPGGTSATLFLRYKEYTRAGRGAQASKQKKRAPNYNILTSIVTPEGSERLVRASITFGEGSRMSMMRLCTRISNCSRASL